MAEGPARGGGGWCAVLGLAGTGAALLTPGVPGRGAEELGRAAGGACAPRRASAGCASALASTTMRRARAASWRRSAGWRVERRRPPQAQFRRVKAFGPVRSNCTGPRTASYPNASAPRRRRLRPPAAAQARGALDQRSDLRVHGSLLDQWRAAITGRNEKCRECSCRRSCRVTRRLVARCGAARLRPPQRCCGLAPRMAIAPVLHLSHRRRNDGASDLPARQAASRLPPRSWRRSGLRSFRGGIGDGAP